MTTPREQLIARLRIPLPIIADIIEAGHLDK